MPWFSFVWNDEIIEHLAEHDISPEDFENIVTDPVDTDRSRSSGRRGAWGYTLDGRLAFAVYELIDDLTVIPVTCFEADE